MTTHDLMRAVEAIRPVRNSAFRQRLQHADWFVIPISHETRPVFAGFIPAKYGLIEDTWQTLGM